MSSTPQDVQDFVVDAIVSLGPERDHIRPEATLESLDVDSLDLVELSQMVEERFDVKLQPDDLKDVETVGQAIDVIREKVH